MGAKQHIQVSQGAKDMPTEDLLSVQQFAVLAGKTPQSIYKRLNKVDNQVDNPIQPYVVDVDGQKMLKKQALFDVYGLEVVNLIQPGCQPENEKLSTSFNQVDNPVQPQNTDGKNSEIEFMREQLRRQEDTIDFLHRELEKEREHNREKDRQLLETLAKLAESQAALAIGQSAEKQKELADTLISGKRMEADFCDMDDTPDYGDFDAEFHDKPVRRGFWQWLRDTIDGL